MRYVLAYEVTDDARRTRLASILLDYGDRVQYSVYEADLDQSDLAEFMNRATAAMKLDEDNLRIYPMCNSCGAMIRDLGTSRDVTPQWVERLAEAGGRQSWH